MKFTKKTDYALRTMQFLARNKDLGALSVKHVAQQCKLSFKFLQVIVSQLGRERLLLTVPGPKGGILLPRDPTEITILEIIQAVEGKIELMSCVSTPNHCSDYEGCGILNVLHGAQAALVNYLQNTNLALMVKAKSDPFAFSPHGHFMEPQFGCPVLK